MTKLYVDTLEDGKLNIEWIDENWRFWLWFDDDENEDERMGWTFVSNKHEPKYGYLPEKFLEEIRAYDT